MSAPPPMTPFLDLPPQYNTWVCDQIHFNFDGTAEHPLDDTTTGTGILLVRKIIDGLRNWKSHSSESYEAEDITKVAGLVERNLYTVHSAQVKGEVERITNEKSEDVAAEEDSRTRDIPRLTTELMLRGLLDKTVTRDAVVQMNSNEPVMLINFDARDWASSGRLTTKEQDVLNYITNIATTYVQDKWNIWPVRMYAGAFLPVDPEGERNDPSFSITLLNVVNTDIGGPSMPQLLDEPCGAPEWNRLLRKEVWRGRELVSREDNADATEQGSAPDKDDASERSLQSDGDDESVGSDAQEHLTILEDSRRERDGSRVVEQEHEHEHEPANIPIEEAGNEPVHGLHSAAQHNDLEPIDVREGEVHGRDSAEAEIQEGPLSQEPEPPARRISHPTWDRHDDNTSLLDLIRSQASIIAPFGTDTAGHGVADLESEVAGPSEVIIEPARDVEGVQPVEEAPKAKSSDEDEFVVV